MLYSKDGPPFAINGIVISTLNLAWKDSFISLFYNILGGTFGLKTPNHDLDIIQIIFFF